VYFLLFFIISICNVTCSYGESYKIGTLYDKRNSNNDELVKLVEQYNKANNTNKILLYSYGASIKDYNKVIDNLVNRVKVDAILCAGDSTADLQILKYSESTCFPILSCSDNNRKPDNDKSLFSTFDNMKSILSKYQSKKNDKQNELKLLSEKQKKEFLKKTTRFRNNIQIGDETTYGMIIEVKKPLAKVQTTTYVVSHYTEWKTKYNQYGSYKDPEVATQSNPVPVEKWFKITDLFPIE